MAVINYDLRVIFSSYSRVSDYQINHSRRLENWPVTAANLAAVSSQW